MTKPLRRADRRLDDESAMALLKRGEYGILSTSDTNNRPYGIPVNYVVMDERIYFHCATEGHKLENIMANKDVSFCVVGKTELIPDKFSTRYESIVISGNADIIENNDLKRKALRALITKYAPDHMSAGDENIEKLMARTAVVQIIVDQMIGKYRK